MTPSTGRSQHCPMSDAYQITIKATDNTWEVFRGRHHVRTRPVKSKKTGALAEAIMVVSVDKFV